MRFVVQGSPAWPDRATYPFPFRFADVPGGRLHHVDVGTGPTLVFAHGTPTWSYEFRHLVAALSTTHRCGHVPFETRWSERVRGGVHWSATVEADEVASMWLLAGEVLGLGTYVSRGFGRYAVKMIGGGQ